MAIVGTGMDQAVRFHRANSQVPVSLERPVKNLKVTFLQLPAHGFWRMLGRSELTAFHKNLSTTSSMRARSRDFTRPRDGWQIGARGPDHSDEDSSSEFESFTSPAALDSSTGIVNELKKEHAVYQVVRTIASLGLLWKTFSRLPSSVPWDGTAVAVTFVAYLGVVHGPFGLGGLSIVASLLHQPDLDPQTKAVSLLLLQLFEMGGGLWLVQSTVKLYGLVPHSIFGLNFSKVWRNRGWLPTSAFCLACLLLVVRFTASLEECVPKGMEQSNPVLELVTASQISGTCFYTVSCLITPYLEEFMYRGFLLTSLAAYFGLPGAVLASSAVFVFAHLPVAAGGQIFGLFLIGCLLGTSYAYTGNLATSFVIHALYNATLLLALSSSSSSSSC